jgi:hypothetical protein
MKNKICTKCHKNLSLSSFNKLKISKDGLAYECKLCGGERNKKYNKDNKEKISLTHKKHYQKNKKTIIENSKVYNEKNYEKIKEYKKSYLENPTNKEIQKLNVKEWRTENIEHHRKTRREYMRDYRKTNPNYILKENVSHYIRRVLNGGKSGSYEKYLGCNIEEYKKYLENQFDEKMTWESYGKDGYWEIDHIIPTSKGGSFHYTNTRPLSIFENRSKKDKL